MAVGDAHAFPGFFHTSTNTTCFPKLPTTFLTCFRGESWKYAEKELRLNRVSSSQTSGHESDTLTTEPPGWGFFFSDGKNMWYALGKGNFLHTCDALYNVWHLKIMEP